ncbi:MAG: potassium transporter Kup, partial [Proteobacteria bacterium]|nr:potassium transporter Kup [Pseudomonadota bacterium]
MVFGDIGTSPLYTLRACFTAAGIPLTPENIFGILSLISTSLLLVVTVKYVGVVLRADNHGEGGTFALTTLALDNFAKPYQRNVILFLGLAGAALFYGDALITPAISVLSAVEGLKVASPNFAAFVIPITLTLLIGLFSLQQQGTHTVGVLFGPIMLVWFSTLGVLGLLEIFHNPTILQALSPHHALAFLLHHPEVSFITLGAVVLAITGAEALYADMGHYGRKPIQYGWLFMVFPCLMLNYFGQGSLLLRDATAIANPFYLLVPQPFQLPMVVLATAASVIASQAVISGAYSLTQQAVQLGYLPRMDIRHTSAQHVGQIYIPLMNWLLCLGTIILVLEFHSSEHLASAYGIAVTGTMLTTTLLLALVLKNRNHWSWFSVGLFLLFFGLIDLAFLAANLQKIAQGGYFPLALGLAILFIMHTWIRGRAQAHKITLTHTPPLDKFLVMLDAKLPKIRHTAIFLTSNLNHVPPALMYNLQHNEVWHAQTIILKINRAKLPRYPESERISIHHHPHNVTT